MEMIKSLAFEFRYVLIMLIVALIYMIFEWQHAKVIFYQLMVKAKSMAKDCILHSGKEQEDWVVKRAYQFLPSRITIFINEKKMHEIVHYLYEKAKDYIDDGKINNSYKQ